MEIGRIFAGSSRIVNAVSKAIHIVGVSILALLMVLTVMDVGLRYFLNKPITSTFELTEFMMAVLVSFCLAHTASHGGHVNVDIVTSRLPRKISAILGAISNFITTSIFTLVTWQCFAQARTIYQSGLESDVLYIPVFPICYGYRTWILVNLLSVPDKLFSFFMRGGRQMEPLTIGIIGIFLLLVALFCGLPIGVGMLVVGMVGFSFVSGWGPGLGILKTVPFASISSHGLSVVPLFILMGEFAFRAGISKDLYETTYKWFGSMRGGLAMATVGACAGFAAVSGSSLATTGAMGEVALPEMKKYKYHDSLATGCIAAGGSIGIMIPPSVVLIIYGVLTEQSVGKLFLAGFLPGILEAVFYIVVIYILTTRNPLLGPPGPATTFMEKISSLKNTWQVLILFILVIGGIYAGIFSPTEAGAVGAFGTLVLGIIKRRITWHSFTESLMGAGRITAMAFLILIGAMVFGYFLAVTRLPFEMADLVSGLPLNRYLLLAFILVIYLFLGCIMEVLGMTILVVPIFFPMIVALGFDPIWFGILTVRAVEIGQITPPVGINVFVMQAVSKGVSLETIYRGIFPFFIGDICLLVLLVAFPKISLFLPSLMN